MHREHTVWPGTDHALGATWDGHGVNFAVYSENAEKVELCLFDAQGRKEVQRIDVRWNTEGVWHCYLPEARPGLLYGYRVSGPYAPAQGHRFNPSKLLIDPYARDLVGPLQWNDALYGFRRRGPAEEPDPRDSARFVPKGRVVDPAYSWGEDRPPRISMRDTVVYEAHVKGLTARHPDVPPEVRGTYAGLASPPMIEHFRKLGVTAIELLPIHFLVDEHRLVKGGLKNYWGYNSLGFFAPDSRYSATGDPVTEFKTMVSRLHDSGFEVLLDVVYNHTGESGHDGPTLAFRGLDNAVYYRLEPAFQARYVDYTGCGNTLDTRHPRVLQLIADSLRYWVQEMRVDGFRFDLASALAREEHAFEPGSGFLDVLRQDPVLSNVKLIAEPWDVGDGGYQVGGFPRGWSEWNAEYRDTVRRFWKGDVGTLGSLASCLSGSSDRFWSRRPQASVNFVTAHDGFTLLDLVSYNDKHNLANLEDGRDGMNNNYSWNCGVEGATTDPEVLDLRARQQRNFLFTLLLSQGVPMLVAGDEISRTQSGNNNAYCQDNEISWVDWTPNPERQHLMHFLRRLIALRRRHPVFRRRKFFQGLLPDRKVKDVVWLSPEGREMTQDDWVHPEGRCLGMFLCGDCLDQTDHHGGPVHDESFLLLLNGGDSKVAFKLPRLRSWADWSLVLDTTGETPTCLPQGGQVPLPPRSAALLLEVAAED